MEDILLRVEDLVKSFPGVRALSGVSFEVRKGEIHALVGENGAGKSTLLKVLSAAQQPDAGRIFFEGRPLRLGSPKEAQQSGIVCIYQEFTLFPQLTIAENILIGREPVRGGLIDWPRMKAETVKITSQLGLTVSPLTPVRRLSVAEQQLVEIARALSMNSRLLIMDEPTSALSVSEVEKLIGIVRLLRDRGLSIIFVTHRLEEVFQCCDRFTVLRDGEVAGRGNIAGVTVKDVISMMVGREITRIADAKSRPCSARVALEVENLTRRASERDPHAIELHSIGLQVRYGEIVGLAGLVGSGRTEVARIIFGADRCTHGEIRVDGKPASIRSPADAIRHGICLVPEDRKQQALFLKQNLRINFSIAGFRKFTRWLLFFDERAEARLLADYREKLRIAMVSPDQMVAKLSGGNQQKLILSRWLMMEPKILIVDEPTRGIDVGAKAEVHRLLLTLARSGLAVLVISSELPEILVLCDRILTMRRGRITGEFTREGATERILMEYMALDKNGRQ